MTTETNKPKYWPVLAAAFAIGIALVSTEGVALVSKKHPLPDKAPRIETISRTATIEPEMADLETLALGNKSVQLNLTDTMKID